MPKPGAQKLSKTSRQSQQQTRKDITDPRFASIQTDPRFRLPSKKHTHVQLDKRFARMLRDDEFSKKASVDKYGRKLEKGSGRGELERFYRMEDEEEGSTSDEDGEAEEGNEADDDEEVQRELKRVGQNYDPARQGGFSESSSDEDSDDEEIEEVDVEDAVLEEDPQAGIPTGDASARIAVVNLDWDNIRAVDLMAVAQSFAPPAGRILKVTVFPSEYGRERMEREEIEGPPKDIFGNGNTEDDVDDKEDSEEEDEKIKKSLLQEDKGEEFDSAKLRQYQLERLKYFYAVIECNSTSTAQALYDNMDGREYLSTANFFDLRFIPDETTFDDDKPRDECDDVPVGYKPNDFVTGALTHSKVKLTWDADDATRKEVQKRAFSRAEIDENDLMAYIGSDSEESDDEARRLKMRAALGLSDGPTTSKGKKKDVEDAVVGDVQVTFTPGLSTGEKGQVFLNEPVTEETTREKYIRKEKERKQRRKDKMKASRTGAATTAAESDAEQGDPAGITAVGDGDDEGFNDPFFTDPTAARDAEKAARKAEKAKKREEREAEEKAAAAQRAELELLMVDEQADTSIKHFNMDDIAKAEKAKNRKGKKGKKSKPSKGADGATEGDGEGQGGFQMDVSDPRFSKLFERHEFAIDPTNPRFTGTDGMKALLEEGRRKRKMDSGDADGETRVNEKKIKKSSEKNAVREDVDDIKRLVQKVKGKNKSKA